MQQFVTPNHLSLRIRKKWERVASFATEIFRNVRSINADGDRQDALRFKFRQRLFDSSQLEVAIGSPVSAVENQKKSLGLLFPSRSREQLRQRNRMPQAIGQRKIRHPLADLWSRGGLCGNVPRAPKERDRTSKEQQGKHRCDAPRNLSCVSR